MKPGEVWVGLDPGTTKTGWVVSNVERLSNGLLHLVPKTLCHDDNLTVARHCRGWGIGYKVAIEMVAGYGMRVGKDVFENVFWTGRFFEAANRVNSSGRSNVIRVYRKEVTLELCGVRSASKAAHKRAIEDRYGGQEIAIGGKKCQRCKGEGVAGRAACPECDSKKCQRCKGKGWFGAGRPVCTKCSGEKCPSCKGNKWLSRPVCLECNGSCLETPKGPLHLLNGSGDHCWDAFMVSWYAANYGERK